MKLERQIIKSVHFVLGASIVGLAWIVAVNFIPVGRVNGEIIYSYQLNNRLKSMSGNAVKNIGKDIIFLKAMEELNLVVTEQEIEKGIKSYEERYGGRTELENILLDTHGDIESLKISIKKSLYNEKAIQHYANIVSLTDEEIAAYYEQNKEEYGNDFITIKDKIVNDLKMKKGLDMLNEYMKKLDDETNIQVFSL